MNLNLDVVKRHILIGSFAFILSGLFNANADAQGFNFDLGSTTVDVTSGTGFAPASVTVAIENPTSSALDIAGYSIFFDIDPAGGGLPTGVIFDTTNGDNDAVTYISGEGNQPLIAAAQTPPGAAINLSPAAGDVGLGQFQFFNGSVEAGASLDLLTVNFLVDRSAAVLGDFTISLDSTGQNVVNTADGSEQEFESTTGTFSIVSSEVVPEPSSLVMLGLLQAVLIMRRRKS